MNCNDIQQKVVDYLDGQLSVNEKNEFENHIQSCDKCLQTLQQSKNLLALMNDVPEVEVPAELDLELKQMISEEKARLSSRPVTIQFSFKWKQVAAALLIFVSGAIAGKYLFNRSDNGIRMVQVAEMQQEMESMRQLLMVSMLQQESPSERLKAVYSVEQMQQLDDNVVSVLFTTLNEDKNVNVRLAAANALVEHSQNEAIRQGLIQALEQQTEPLIQIVLIKSLAQMKEKNSVPVIERLMVNEQLHETVQSEAEKAVKVLL